MVLRMLVISVIVAL